MLANVSSAESAIFQYYLAISNNAGSMCCCGTTSYILMHIPVSQRMDPTLFLLSNFIYVFTNSLQLI